MALGQEHVPKAQGPRLLLEIINDGRVGLPSCVALAQLSLQDCIGSFPGLLARPPAGRRRR